jgi:hypothetical protein
MCRLPGVSPVGRYNKCLMEEGSSPLLFIVADGLLVLLNRSDSTGKRKIVSVGNANARPVLLAAHSDGSWLHLAESELSVLSTQSLDEASPTNRP